MSLRTEQAQAQAELQAQAEAQRLAFREQVRHLQDEQRSTVETLHAQLSRLEEQLFTLQSQSGKEQPFIMAIIKYSPVNLMTQRNYTRR
jgi:predicted phage gp36 major capsid-like protein